MINSKTIFLATTFAAVLSGCAEMMANRMAQMDSEDLCVSVVSDRFERQAAVNELRNRLYSCDWDRARQIAAYREQSRQAAFQALGGYVNSMNAQTDALNANAARQAQSISPINCTSNVWNGQLYTQCR